MPSCTVPIFSKIDVTLRATQPAMLVICQDSGSTIATDPTEMRPLFHCQIASDAVETISVAFISDSITT